MAYLEKTSATKAREKFYKGFGWAWEVWSEQDQKWMHNRWLRGPAAWAQKHN